MSVTPRIDNYRLMRAGYRMAIACELCGNEDNLVIDHIIPLSRGGTNDLDNLRTLCNSCNVKEAWKYRERQNLPKYTTHLRPETIHDLKLHAIIHKMA